MIENTHLLIFDVSALAHGSELTEAGQDFLSKLSALPGDQIPRVALIAQDGRPSLRAWMEDELFGDPETLPTFDEFREWVWDVAHQMPLAVKVYLSVAYKDIEIRRWAPVPFEYAGDPSWSPAWRKPQPGMIKQAMADYGVANPLRVLLIGNSLDDVAAARTAGIRFLYAKEFYREVWTQGVLFEV